MPWGFMWPSLPGRKLAVACLSVVLAGAVASGCAGVRRTMSVTSEPSGADVTINGEHVGKTPVEVPFLWYWYYDIEGEMKNHETALKRVRLRAPWYLWPPLDLAAEMMPFHVADRKQIHLELEPDRRSPEPEFVQ